MISFEDQSRAFVDVIFEGFGRIVAKICLHTRINLHKRSWIEPMSWTFDWDLFACKIDMLVFY
jgi:hypothetical protein